MYLDGVFLLKLFVLLAGMINAGVATTFTYAIGYASTELAERLFQVMLKKKIGRAHV